MIDYSIHMLGELQKLEEMSLEYKGELKYLSKRIRHDIWDVNNAENTEKLAKLLQSMLGYWLNIVSLYAQILMLIIIID